MLAGLCKDVFMFYETEPWFHGEQNSATFQNVSHIAIQATQRGDYISYGS